jgi:microcin C transport system substrate-binding protein
MSNFPFDILKSQQAHPQYRIYWKDIKSAQVIDKYTVRFEFSQVNPELYLIAAEIPVFSKAATESEAFDQIVTKPLVGTGPYRMGDYQMGKYITYQRRPDYWAKDLNTRRGMYNFDHVTFKYYKDREISLEALKSGEFDFMAVYNSKAWAREYVGPQFDSGKLVKAEFEHQK